MRAKDLLDTLTDEQLTAKADECFAAAEAPIHPPQERQRLLAEADFYLKALAWRHDERVSQRDFRLEIWVIILIGIEIALSVYGLWEGHQQGKVMDGQLIALKDMDTKTGKTAEAMSTMGDRMQALAEKQSESLARLDEMNSALKGSLATTKKEFALLKEEQDARLAELAKKPKLALYSRNAPLLTPNLPISTRDETDTSINLDVTLRNEGTATATGMELRVVIFSKDASLTAVQNLRYERTGEEPGTDYHTYVIRIDRLRPNVQIPMTLTFSYPKGQAPFQLLFNADADNIETGTLLGSAQLTPKKPTT